VNENTTDPMEVEAAIGAPNVALREDMRSFAIAELDDARHLDALIRASGGPSDG
jgi:hypothetical protein